MAIEPDAGISNAVRRYGVADPELADRLLSLKDLDRLGRFCQANVDEKRASSPVSWLTRTIVLPRCCILAK